ncbi:HNH endonuclease [Sinorhizobium meliloti]|uniref:HNH endonuclease n=1 Tax=Rhizobium meliloti TaxID=382 RepID=UPI001F3B2CE1|nr:HNH endonuclease [Sinorhizobium meliloti]
MKRVTRPFAGYVFSATFLQTDRKTIDEEPGLVGNWEGTRRLVLERDGYRCVSCSTKLSSRDADVHHLLPRSMGGSDELSNLVTLCDGCHAAHHPNLAGGLARRVIERWAMRLARWLDEEARALGADMNFGPVLRLFGTPHFRGGAASDRPGSAVREIDPGRQSHRDQGSRCASNSLPCFATGLRSSSVR